MVKKNQILPHIDDNYTIKNSKTRSEILNYYLNSDLPNKRPKCKINNDEFSIPKINEYNNLLTINYNLQQLKKINKFYNYKIAGNKDDLKKHIYNNMYYSYYATIIQKTAKLYFVKKYLYLHGPGFFDKSKCANDCDFCTLDELNIIPYSQFISFKDDDKFIYGFDINSLYNLYVKNKSQVENPFNKKIIGKNVFNTLIKYIKYSNLLNITVNINYNELQNLSESKLMEIKILSLFQSMDSLGNYTNMSWFTSLNKYDLIKFLRELNDIWNYRANLTQEVKREICPPFGNPFRNMNFASFSSLNINSIKKLAINIMDELVNKGINNDSKSLGCYYVLSALTLVSSSAAEAMPWLYESVTY